METSVKENAKSNIQDTMKRSNIKIIGIEEREKAQTKGSESIFNKIIEENLPYLKKMSIKGKKHTELGSGGTYL